MGDASGTYASPTGSDLQHGGAGQQQGNDEGYENESFQLEPGEQNSGQESMRRASIGTTATQLGGAGTPTTTQQESPAPTADPLLQSLLISVRLFTQKVNLIVKRQSEKGRASSGGSEAKATELGQGKGEGHRLSERCIRRRCVGRRFHRE